MNAYGVIITHPTLEFVNWGVVKADSLAEAATKAQAECDKYIDGRQVVEVHRLPEGEAEYNDAVADPENCVPVIWTIQLKTR